MSPTRRRAKRSGAGEWRITEMVGVSGWALADVLVGLMLISLISIQGVRQITTPPPPPPTAPVSAGATPPVTRVPPPPTDTPTPTQVPAPPPTTTPTHTPTPTPTSTPTPCRTTIQLNRIDPDPLARQAAPGQDPTDAELRRIFAPYASQRAGLVLTFGYGTTVNEGQRLADRVNARLRQLLPGTFTSVTKFETLRWEGTAQEVGNVRFWVYLVDEVCQ